MWGGACHCEQSTGQRGGQRTVTGRNWAASGLAPWSTALHLDPTLGSMSDGASRHLHPTHWTGPYPGREGWRQASEGCWWKLPVEMLKFPTSRFHPGVQGTLKCVRSFEPPFFPPRSPGSRRGHGHHSPGLLLILAPPSLTIIPSQQSLLPGPFFQ